MEDTIPTNQDESYWFIEDFPAAKCDVVSTSNAPKMSEARILIFLLLQVDGWTHCSALTS
jgi:hypothetical protein